MFDAIVIADVATATWRVAGLTLVERARRVAHRAGARRVYVISDAATRAGVNAWWSTDPSEHVLVIRGGDQLVHTPLVAPLIEAARDQAAIAWLAIGPSRPQQDDTGAMLIARAALDDVLTWLRDGLDTATIAAQLRARGGRDVEHGAVARAPVRNSDEQRAARKLIFTILVKPQDNAITRVLYRPISMPLTRLLVGTPITPNQVSYAVAVLVAIGCYFAARAGFSSVIVGTAIILAASYLDCCDGEIARLKLTSSRFGAWLDTIVDELSSFGYMVAVGIHCQRHFGADYLSSLGWPGPGHGWPSPWMVGVIASLVTYAITMYVIYFNIIVVVGSANSQDYVGRFVVQRDGGAARLLPQPAAVRTTPRPAWLQWCATYLPYAVRRDFISWFTLLLAVLHVTQVTFAILVLGGVVTASIVGVEHLRLRRQLRAIKSEGLRLQR